MLSVMSAVQRRRHHDMEPAWVTSRSVMQRRKCMPGSFEAAMLATASEEIACAGNVAVAATASSKEPTSCTACKVL